MNDSGERVSNRRAGGSRIRCFGFAAVLCLLSPAALAQSVYGGIHGTVRDSSGEPLGGAEVTATSVEKGTQIHTKTDARGNYQFPQLQPDTYDVRLEASGRKFSVTDISVSADDESLADLTLPAAGQSGTVQGASTLRTRADNSITLDRNAIACVGSWRYASRNSDGTPTRRHMKEIILWGPGPSAAQGSTHVCPQDAMAAGLFTASGTTLIAFTIGDDGTVKNPYVWVSSGHLYLDGASIACVSNWRYVPIILDGKPTEFPWQAQVAWKVMDVGPVSIRTK